MPSTRLALLAAAGLGLAACVRPANDPLPPGTSAGVGQPNIMELSRQAPGSAPVSQGTPTIAGTRGGGGGEGSGRPEVTYSGPGTGNIGGPTPTPFPAFRSRSN